MKKALGIFSLLASILWVGCNGTDTTTTEGSETKVSTPVLSYSVISVLPHDTSYFTEGLEFYNNTLLESTGNYDGRSKLVRKDLSTNKVLNSVTLDPKQFGEGITVFRDTIYQLTYKERTINVYAAKDLRKIKEMPYNLEGWGLTNDGKSLIASDGSSNLYFFEPGTFRQLRVQAV
ncbi:MAG TPA: glutaminyl-peptide cyclotransferase, partial [Flavisolibacter sp.]|nr:glutaminyl-peptide cyclotransferase [Flavisolibacter sp.]